MPAKTAFRPAIHAARAANALLFNGFRVVRESGAAL
jgi:hypothetical protein